MPLCILKKVRPKRWFVLVVNLLVFEGVGLKEGCLYIGTFQKFVYCLSCINAIQHISSLKQLILVATPVSIGVSLN
jgi:hypothetical protein